MLRRAVRSLALSAVVTTALGADEPSVVTPPPATHSTFTQFANILECLQKNYVYPLHISASEHSTAALREFVRSLDPEADLLTADEVAAAATPKGDVGLSLALHGDYPTAIAPHDGSPAQKARLLAGDQIVAIDGQTTAHARLFKVASQLRGEIGSTISLRVLDPGSGKTRDVTLTRAADRSQPPPSLKFLGDGIAYLRIGEFTLPVVEKLHAEMKRAQAQKTRAVILDLRNNAGGAFDATLVAARLFLPANADIVALEYSQPAFRTAFVSDVSEKFNAPLVVLVNGGSADEAEIFAAALSDKKRARLVGTKTFGHGQLITQFPLPDGSALLIPTAVYLPPSRRVFDETGLTPEVSVSVARETERNLSAAGFGSFDSAKDKAQTVSADPALARAVELLAK